MASKTSSAFCQALVRAHCWMSDVNAAARGWNVLSRIARRTSPVPGVAALTASLRLSMSVAGALPCAQHHAAVPRQLRSRRMQSQTRPLTAPCLAHHARRAGLTSMPALSRGPVAQAQPAGTRGKAVQGSHRGCL